MRRSLTVVVLAYLLLGSDGARRPLLSEEDDTALDMLYKSYAKTFKDKYGVIFDCVDMYKQPALDHPLLKNHKLQVLPSSSTAGAPVPFGLQESCPDGTVPVRRYVKRDKAYTQISGQHFAQLLIESEEGSQFQEASATIEVDTLIISAGQVSSAQILLVNEGISGRLIVIQAGWAADDHNTTGCRNMDCPGFVLLSQTKTPGMVLPTGTASVSISKDTQTGNWFVFLDQEIVGYFPKEIINNMSGATNVQMGGITYAPPGQGSPPMGTGVAPMLGKKNLASQFVQIVVKGAKIAKYWVDKDVSNPDIYNIVMTSASSTGPQGVSFQYGGPGGTYH
ncbi:hypothetical protein EJB05_49313 [Eragrostis curvula]|uniref:Neprosin PEP catalytic domain-containing protein n=1 Tax=Eragrostis curvula TaxID=38414 RepID=A0A5J9T426_9POAL|nr:hypothetical protein EJB05_49313 [Eragrostis curvula]